MITAFLPCRKGSQRVVGKNTRQFGHRMDGLLGIKLDHLVACDLIDEVVLSTNDNDVVDVAKRYGSRVKLDIRPEHLCTSQTSTDDLIKYVPSIISSGHLLWTHVTSPFFNDQDYANAVRVYLDAIESGHNDSLMTVTRVQNFLWHESAPINYDRGIERWPRTQTLPVFNEINSAVFLISVEKMREYGDRIGDKPYLLQVDKNKAIDVDWEDDFELASRIFTLKSPPEP